MGSESAVADLFGRLGVWLGQVPRYRRQVVIHNLAMVFPRGQAAELEQLADDVYEHLGRTVAEVFATDLSATARKVEADPGWAAVDQALAQGRGAIVATGHIGNFELGGVTLARRYRLLDVVKSQRNPLFDHYINALRASRGILTVPMDKSGPRVLRHLRSGGLVSLLLDQDAGNDGLTVDFLGSPASTWPGAARLSIRTGCPVIPMAILRQGDGNHRLAISEPLWPGSRSDCPEDVQEYLQLISRAVEEFILDHPEQWFWVHRRWKSNPAVG